MTDRILTWFIRTAADLEWVPRYYADDDYEPVALRVYADTSPVTDDLAVDIQADGVSIFNNLPTYSFTSLGQRVSVPTTTPVLNKGEQESASEDGDFNGNPISEGAWITLSIPDLRGAKGVSLQLELNKVEDSQ